MTSVDPHCQIESPSAAVAAITDLLAAPRPWDLPSTSRQLRKLLKAMQHSLQQNRTSASSDSRLVPCLQSLLHFGWDAEENKEQIPSLVQKSTSSPIKNKYVPPGARQQQQQQSSYISLSHAPSSDSEGTSDAENGPGIGTDIKLSRVRFLALACLQLLIKSDPKAMHPLWPTLLPEPDSDLSSKACALSKSGSTNMIPLTLAHPLLLDSSARVRHSAAVTLGTLLEGPAQRAYLAVAELAGAAPQAQKQARVRGFVPLSSTLGIVVVGTHAALLRALTSEQDISVVVAILRALGTALVGTPYSRLPGSLLPNCVDAIRKVLQKAQQQAQQHEYSLNPPSTSPSAVHYTAVPLLSSGLACLAAALAIKPPLSSLSEYLSTKNGVSLAQEIFACILQYGNFPAVQLEALMALRGLTQQYHGAVEHLWEDMLQFATLSVQSQMSCSSSTVCSEGNNVTVHTNNAHATNSNGIIIVEGGSPSSREKVIQQSILLLGDYFNHSSSSSSSSKRNAQRTATLCSSEARGELEVIQEPKTEEKKWNDAVEMCIRPLIAQQESPLLQAAGFGTIATALGFRVSLNRQVTVTDCADTAKTSLTSSLLYSREMRADLLAKCSKVLHLDTTRGGGDGGVGAGGLAASSPVRAAATKAMASLITAVPLSQDFSVLIDALPSLLAACQDDVVAVRVQAATALAAVGDALYILFQTIEQQQQQQHADIQQILCTDALTALVPAAVAAAGDGDKIKPSGVQALGTFLACRQLTKTTRATATAHAEQRAENPSVTVLQEKEKDAFIACISSENAKVQWSACYAAGIFLEALQKIYKQGGAHNKMSSQEKDANIDGFKDAVRDTELPGEVQELVEALQQVAEESRNTRSRALALAALAHCA